MKKSAPLFIALVPFLWLLQGCEFSVKPPGGLKKFFATEADTRYYERKCANLVDQMDGKMEEYGIRRIAVIDFVDIEGKVSELGKFLAAKLMVQIPKKSPFIVVQKGHVDMALRDLQISPMESYTLQTTKDIGNKLGVDGLLLGKIVDLGTNIDINLKLIDVNTGDLIATASESLARTKYAVEMSNRYTGSAH